MVFYTPDEDIAAYRVKSPKIAPYQHKQTHKHGAQLAVILDGWPRPVFRPVQAIYTAKNAPHLYIFSLALISWAVEDYNPETLFAITATFPAKGIVLPPFIVPYE